MNTADPARQARPDAPVKFGTDVVVVAYAGIIAAASGSLTFNIWHATHKGHLQILLAVILGFLPPFLATALAHLAAATRLGRPGRAWVFFITAGMMFVSAYSSAQVLEPADGLPVSILFSLFTDAASMTCLFILMKAFAASADYAKWFATYGQPAQAVVPGTSGNDKALAVSGTAAGPGNASLPDAPGTTVAPAREPGRSGTGAHVAAARSKAELAVRTPAGAGEDRTAVVAEIATRPRPALETAEQRQARALAAVTEFKQRTGQRMNNTELARALGMRKARRRPDPRGPAAPRERRMTSCLLPLQAAPAEASGPARAVCGGTPGRNARALPRPGGCRGAGQGGPLRGVCTGTRVHRHACAHASTTEGGCASMPRRRIPRSQTRAEYWVEELARSRQWRRGPGNRLAVGQERDRQPRRYASRRGRGRQLGTGQAAGRLRVAPAPGQDPAPQRPGRLGAPAAP